MPIILEFTLDFVQKNVDLRSQFIHELKNYDVCVHQKHVFKINMYSKTTQKSNIQTSNYVQVQIN